MDAMAPKELQRATAMQSIFPIKQLPREILAEIFWYSTPEVKSDRMPVQMLKRAAPLLPSSVCSSWRELALAMPELWSSVGIIIRDPDRDPSASAHVIDTWLKRSRTLPLTLSLGQLSLLYDNHRSKTKPALVKSILSVFYSHSSRWQDVSLYLYDTRSLSLPQLKTPLLRSFDLAGLMDYKPIRFPFRESPHLTRLSWPFALDASKNPQVPWHQISYLSISNGMTLFSVLETIRLCPQLEEFTVDCSGSDEADEVANLPHEPIVKNRRLRKLKLHVYEDCSSMLDSMMLPALEEFNLHFPEVDGDFYTSVQQSLLDFLTRSNCKLKKLGLSDCKFSADEFIECLEHKASETIRELRIGEWPKLTDDVLLWLTYPPSSPASHILLPKLTQLTLEYCLDTSPGLLGEMVSSRYYPETNEVEKLDDLVLSLQELDEEDETIIQDMVADGLNAKIDILS
ncbi:hypothetical protein F5887DRAFT_962750 [Amanita rubescens]|nr:hypothetical protein F5887DRAFT_962750 [Amanita rubescens]